MTRQEALQTLQTYVKSPSLVRHHFATEIAMRMIARTLVEKSKLTINEEEWAITGLLHDADYELTRTTPERHTLLLEERLGSVLSPEVIHAIKAHNYKYTGVVPASKMDWAMYSCDELTGFIIFCVLNQKEQSLRLLTVDFVLQKLKDQTFAPTVERSQISSCEKNLGIPLPEYTKIVLTSMQSIAKSLGFES
jgi:predicted hydrolase (HD superfamily)